MAATRCAPKLVISQRMRLLLTAFWHNAIIKMPRKRHGRENSTGFHHLLDYKGKQVMHMSDFEILSIVFVMIGLLMTAYKLGKSNR